MTTCRVPPTNSVIAASRDGLARSKRFPVHASIRAPRMLFYEPAAGQPRPHALSFDVNANQQPAHLSRWRTRTLSKSTRHFSRDLQNAAGSKKAIRDIDAQIGQRIREARQAQGMAKAVLTNGLGISFQQVQRTRTAPIGSALHGSATSPSYLECRSLSFMKVLSPSCGR